MRRGLRRSVFGARVLSRALLLGALLAFALPCAGCGLLMRPDPIGFRTYTLKNCSYDDAVAVVHDTTRQYALARFGGVGLTWDAPQGNLTLDPVYDGQRRMKLYLHLSPTGKDVNVEIFALVETLSGGGGSGVGWVNPMQDVPLEEDLFGACVAALLARRDVQP